MKVQLQDVLEFVVGRRCGRCPLNQLELQNLLAVNRGIMELVQMQCFPKVLWSGTNARLFLDRYGTIQPVSRLLNHLLLAPLVLNGVVDLDQVVEFQRKEIPQAVVTLGEEFVGRWESLLLLNALQGGDMDALSGYASMRLSRLLHTILSCGAIWAIALGVAKVSTLIRNSSNQSLCALLGFAEFDAIEENRRYDEFHPNLSCTMRLAGHFTYANFTNTNPRPLLHQWEICKWLWIEMKVKRNRNVRKLFKLCLPDKSGKPKTSPAMVTLLIQTKQSRQALSENLLTVDKAHQLHYLCGLGHIKQLLSTEGLAALRRGTFTIEDLFSIPRHGLVRSLCKFPQLLNCQDIKDMIAPLDDRNKMVDLMIQKRHVWGDGLATASQLLQLPTFEALDFVLSDVGKEALKSKLLSFEDFQPSSQPLNSSNNTRSGPIRFGKSNAKVLQTFFESQMGPHLLKEGTVKVRDIIEYVQTVDVLSIILSPAGAQAMKNNLLQIDQVVAKMRSPQDVLLAIRNSGRIASSSLSSTDKNVEDPATSLQARFSKKQAVKTNTSEEIAMQAQERQHVLSINELMLKTSLRRVDATALLQECDWDVTKALKRASMDSTEPKLVEPKRDTNATRLKKIERFTAQLSDPDKVDPHMVATDWLEKGNWDVEHALKQYNEAVDKFFQDPVVKSQKLERKNGISWLKHHNWNVGQAIHYFQSCYGPSCPSSSSSSSRTNTNDDDGGGGGDDHEICAGQPSCKRAKFFHDVDEENDMDYDEQGLKKLPPEEVEEMTSDGKCCALDRLSDSGDLIAEGEERDTESALPLSPKSEKLPTTLQLNTLLRFLNITGETKEDYSVKILTMCNWKLDDAVRTYLAITGQE